MSTLTFRAAAKAWLAAVGAAAAYFMGVLDPNAVGLSAFASVTTVQWLGAVVAVLSTFGITWAVPNREAKRLMVDPYGYHEAEAGNGNLNSVLYLLVVVVVVLVILRLLGVL